jgi:BlaI family transcriptional regulator, penicillinase repressor
VGQTVDDTKAPTPRELEILKVLWDLGPSTVRQVYEYRFLAQGVAQNTVQTLLRIMAEQKGLVTFHQDGRRFVYTPAYSRDQVAAQFLDNVFDGIASEMVMSLLRSERVSPAELEQMRALIEAARKLNRQRGPGG